MSDEELKSELERVHATSAKSPTADLLDVSQHFVSVTLAT
jgi:hypothetical protein